MPIPLLWVAGAGLVGWIASDVADAADEGSNKLFWVVAGAAGLYFAQKKGII